MKIGKKQLYLALIIILVLFILTFIFFYIFGKLTSDKVNKIDQDVLDVSFSKGKKISINNVLPVSDKLGKEYDGEGVAEGIQDIKEFNIKNNSSNIVAYEIYLTKNKVNNKELSEKYIKLYLTDDKNLAVDGFDTNKVPVFSSLTALNDKPSGILLYRDNINSKEEKNYKLRVWLADSYAISKDEEEFSFNIEVRAI